ncbi:MAG: GAF domain-containing protein, partial [Thermoplasmatota archaeon]
YLYQATLTLAKKTDLKDIIKTIADEAKNLMDASDCTVYLANYEKEVLEPFYTNDPKYKEQIMSYKIPFGEGEAGRVVEKGKSRFLNIEDQREHLVTIPGTKDGDTEEESILTVPLFKDDKINGVLSLSKKRYRFDYEDVNKLKAFAKQAETVLSRADDLEKLQKSKEMISREKQKIEALHKVARDLEKCDSEEKIYEITIDAAKNILDFYICSIMIYEDGNLVIKSTFDEDVNIGDEFSVEEGIYGKTYREQKSYLVNDISNYESAKPTSDNLKAVLSVPIDRFGVFQTLSDRKDFFDEDDLEITELLISHVKEAIRQVRNKNLIEERERKLEALHDVSAKLESCSSEAEAYNMIVSASEDVLNFDICRVHSVEGDKFSVKAVSSKVDKQQKDYEIPLNKGIVGKTYLNNESYLINDFKNNDEVVPFLNDYKSGISVPIGKYGVLQAVSYESDDFDKEDVEMAELLTSHLSEALNRIKSDNRERFLLTLLRHDMMNKSQIVRGYLQILLDMEPTDEQKRFINSAMEANIDSQELLSKIGVLKDIKNVKEMEETKLDLAITHAIDENINFLRDKNIKIKFDKKGFQVLGGHLLEELFSNLIENAVNHAECDFISISSKEDENTVRVIVEDNGMGLSDDIKNKVLKKGFKGKSSKGLGLGTFLVKSIAEIYNGYVEVKDSELGGARFDVILRKA